MLISEQYKEQNRLLHNRPDYGAFGSKWAELVWQIAHQYKAESVLDYGCGKQTLHNTIRENEQAYRFKSHFCCKEHAWLKSWQNYDPAIEGLDAAPKPADLVISTDVLEHVEPECLGAVLDEIGSNAKKAVFLVVATRPAKKTLPDGRNAHLIQEPLHWWMSHLLARFTARQIQNLGGEFVFIGEPLMEKAA